MTLKFSLYGVIILGSVAFASTGMHAESNVAQKQDSVSEAVLVHPVLSTNTWGIFDTKTGVIVTGNNTNVPLPIASITKLFTAVTVMQSSRKNEEFKITASDVDTEGRAGKLFAGQKTTPYELLFPLLIESSNDAGTAIRRDLGDEFNISLSAIIKSKELKNTNIVEPTGLSAKNVSTVTDLSLLYAYLKESYPHILDITSLDTYIDAHTGYANSDPAQKNKNFAGGKQGYTDEAGRTFVGSFTITNSSKEIGIVILGSTNLLNDLNAILSYVDKDSHASGILKP